MDGYLVRQGRDSIVTSKGLSLITLLRGIGVDSLTSPEMTGDWEYQLKQMEQGATDRATFMAGIRKFTEEIVEKAKNYAGDAGSVSGNFHDLEAKDPKTGELAAFKETFKAYESPSGTLIWKTMAGRELEREEVKTLLEAGQVGPLEGFRSKMGRPFSALVKLDADFKQSFDFGNSDSNGAPPDFTNAPIIGLCPVCKKGQVHDIGAAYVCDQTPECKFRTGKVILQKEISAEQVKKLLETGRTDLIPKFISKKNRPFSAYLKLEGAKVGFEFEPRKAAPKKAPAAKKPIAEAA
jgi:DNA topoisomerase-3